MADLHNISAMPVSVLLSAVTLSASCSVFDVITSAHIPLYLYPFLHTTKTSRSFEYLRLTSLGVIGALVKTDEKEVCLVK